MPCSSPLEVKAWDSRGPTSVLRGLGHTPTTPTIIASQLLFAGSQNEIVATPYSDIDWSDLVISNPHAYGIRQGPNGGDAIGRNIVR